MRTIGIIIVLALWILMGWKMCTDYSNCCADLSATQNETSTSAGSPGAIATSGDCANGIICFKDNSCEALFGQRFESYKDSIIAQITSDRVLRITGIYDTSESYEGPDANLGACRAQSIRRAFANLSDDQVRTGGQIMVGRDLTSEDRYLLEVINAGTPLTASANEDTSDGGADVAEASGERSLNAEAVIYFPFNSTNKLDNRAIEAYLNQIANQIKGTNQKVRLTGHTDDIGSEASNKILGQRRANIIADYLIGQGVLRSQIISESKGETAPVASNSTEEGRARNRRTELQIIK